MTDHKDDIERYRAGLMNEAERHALEKKALSDPFLADALEGTEVISAEEFSADINELSEKVQQRHAKHWFTPLRVAAGVILLLGTGALFYFLNPPEPPTMALEKSVLPGVPDSANKLKTDSNAALLSLAGPKKSVTKNSPAALSDAGPLQPDSSIASGGAGNNPVIESQPLGEILAEKAASKISEEEITEDRKELNEESIQTAPTAAGANTRKKSLAFRSDRSKDAPHSALHTIRGNVTANNGSPLPGVNVMVKRSNEGTVTNGNGDFLLAAHALNPELVFSSIDFGVREIKAGEDELIQIQLVPDVNQAGIIVVSGYGITNLEEETVELASPAGGRDAFLKYLETSSRYPAKALNNHTEGKAKVQFNVSADGRLRNLRIMDGPGDGCEEELLRLIKEGPSWSPTRHNSIPIEDQVTVMFRFSLPR